MPIVLLGSDDLAEPLRRLGQQVVICADDSEADIKTDRHDPEWGALEKQLRNRGIKPRAIMVCDRIGARTLPIGLWQSGLPTLFYGVDSPLNYFWHAPYAATFATACLDQLPQADLLKARHPRVFWLPVGINPKLYQGMPSEKPTAGACFVGVVDEHIRPKRTAVLNQVGRHTRLEIKGGRQDKWFATKDAVKLYQSYQVTINENLFAGVTTRPLEVMAAGGCLLSEAAPGQMDKFFTHKEHLCYYQPGTLTNTLKDLLADSALQKRLRRAGRQAVLEGHTLETRARQVLQYLEHPHTPQSHVHALAHEGEALLMAGMRWPEQDPRRLLRARGYLRVAAAQAPVAYIYYLLSMNEACLGQWELAAAALDVAIELADSEAARRTHILNHGLALYYNNQPGKARSLWRRKLNIRSEPGEGGFHLAAADILLAASRDLSPGFSKKKLWPGIWDALEHLSMAVESSEKAPQSQATALFKMGELLLKNQAPNQACDCFSACGELGYDNSLLPQLMARAAEEGYLT